MCNPFLLIFRQEKRSDRCCILSVIRFRHFREEIPVREIARRSGLSRNTVCKYMAAGVVDPQCSQRKTPIKQNAYDLTLTSIENPIAVQTMATGQPSCVHRPRYSG